MEFLILFNNVRTVTDRTTQPTQHHDNNFCYFILFSVRGKKIILLDPLLKIWTNSQVKVTIMQSYSRTQSLPLNLKWAIAMLYKSQINKVNTAGRLGFEGATFCLPFEHMTAPPSCVGVDREVAHKTRRKRWKGLPSLLRLRHFLTYGAIFQWKENSYRWQNEFSPSVVYAGKFIACTRPQDLFSVVLVLEIKDGEEWIVLHLSWCT